MRRVIYIKSTNDKHILSLGISEGEDCARYTLDEKFVLEMGLSPRCEIDEGDYEKIKSRDEYIRAKKKALSILSFADNSRRSLLQKLARAGIGRVCAERVTEEMQSLGYINEGKQLWRLVLRLANSSLFGPKKIMASLVSKGYAPDAVRQTVRELIDSGEIDLSENKRKLLEKHSVDEGDTEAENRLLYKNGY